MVCPLLLYIFSPNLDSPSIYCCVVLFIVFRLCSCFCNVVLRFLLSITQYSFFHDAYLFLLFASFSLCRYLCLSPLHSVSSHLLPTHTQRSCTVDSIHVQRSTWDSYFFFTPASHLAALYSNYLRRGLTAGNINIMACSDGERMLMHNSCTHIQTHHTCSQWTLANHTVYPRHPPFYKTLLC